MGVGGSSREVCRNSEPWGLCIVIANMVSTACRREGSTQLMCFSGSLVGHAPRSNDLSGMHGTGMVRVMPILPTEQLGCQRGITLCLRFQTNDIHQPFEISLPRKA